jgi:hypothetical protein
VQSDLLNPTHASITSVPHSAITEEIGECDPRELEAVEDA